MLNHFIRFLCGMVRFGATDGFVERLINLCATNNISLKKLVRTDVGFTASVVSYDYNTVCELAKKSNVTVYAIAKKGVWFKAKSNKSRIGLLIGAILFFGSIIISQQFVWDITVTGNEKVAATEILYQLQELGIKRGAKIDDIDFRLKKQQALLNLPELSWLTLNQTGSLVRVIVSERNAPPMINDTTPCDIVAAKTGQIRYMNVYGGVKILGEGHPVQEGDLIVSGRFYDKENVQTLVHADAKVIAQVTFDKSLNLDLAQLSKKYTGEIKKRHFVDIGITKLPLFVATKLKGNYDLTKSQSPFSIFSLKLPIMIETHKFSFYDKIGVNLTKEQAKKVLQEGFLQYEQLELRDCAIIGRDAKIISSDDATMTMTVSYTVEQDIAKKVPIQ